MIRRDFIPVGIWLLCAVGLGLGGCAAPTGGRIPGTDPSSAAKANQAAAADLGQIREINLVIRQELPLAPARIDGQEAGFFLIDTGSTTTVIEQSIAEKLHLESVGAMKVTGIAGSLDASVVSLRRLEVGGIGFGDKNAVVVDLTRFKRSLRWPIAGILGFDSLRERPFTIDLKAGVLRLETAQSLAQITGGAIARHEDGAPAPEASPGAGGPATGDRNHAHAGLARAGEHELRLVGGLPAVPGRIGDLAAWLQLDTGSNAFLSVPVDLIRLHPQLLADDHLNRMKPSYGVGGDGGTDSVHALLDRLKVMGMELRRIPLHIESPGVTPWPMGPNQPAIGRLGNSLLKSYRLTVDYPRRKLWARWVEKP